MFQFKASILIPQPLSAVFPFFSKAENLELLTPPWVNFKILTPSPIEMKKGALIDYRIKIHGLPIKWRTEITEWNPPHSFVDVQLKGPYRVWNHQHIFTETSGGTLVEDLVDYDVWGGRIVEALFVRPDVTKIFAFREQKMRELFR